jgi:hypothetical protein
MSIAVRDERFILTATIERTSILILFWIRSKRIPAGPLGDSFSGLLGDGF